MMATLKMQNHVTKLQTDFYEILNCRFKKKMHPILLWHHLGAKELCLSDVKDLI